MVLGRLWAVPSRILSRDRRSRLSISVPARHQTSPQARTVRLPQLRLLETLWRRQQVCCSSMAQTVRTLLKLQHGRRSALQAQALTSLPCAEWRTGSG